ncbi:MAG: hypothetical protein IH618_15535 [Ignavibacteriaceae bacterium]|nr:hypothetical protein [Ignavibacteriaceae bacterium]
MTSAQIKMLKFAGGNLIILKRIALDEKAPVEIRRTAFLALNEKYKEYPVLVFNQDVERRNLKISVDSNN